MDCWFYLTIFFIFLLAKSAGEHPQQMPVALQLFAVAAVAASAPPSEMGSIWFLSHDSCMFNIHACGFFRIVSPKTVRWTIRNEYVGLTGSCWWCSSTSMWNKHIYYHRIQPKWGCQKVQLKNHSKKYRQWRTCASSIMSWDVRLLYIYIYLFIIINICIYIYIVCIYIYIYICVCVCVCVYLCVCIYIYICVYMCVYIYMCVYMNVYNNGYGPWMVSRGFKYPTCIQPLGLSSSGES